MKKGAKKIRYELNKRKELHIEICMQATKRSMAFMVEARKKVKSSNNR